MVKSLSLMGFGVKSRRHRRWSNRIVLGALVTSVLSGAGVADDRFYVLRDGRRVPLTRSTDELGLLFRHCDDVKACAHRLSAAGHGTVENFAAAPEARMKRLRGLRADSAKRRSVLQDPAIRDARPVYRFAGSDTPVVSSGTMVVKLRGDLNDAQRTALWNEYNSVEVEPIRGLDAVYVVRPADDDEDDVLLAGRLADDGRTVWAHPNFYRTMERRQIASDEFFNLQWHLDNTGQTRGTVDADIDAPEAWVISEGAGVLFGMFDDSCDVDHEDLMDNYIGIGQDIALAFFEDGYDDPRPKKADDAHGTAVMGLAVAAANSVGVRGVSFRSQFTASRGLTDFVAAESIVASVYIFALEQGVDVHINSWGFTGNLPDPPVLVDAIDKAFREGRDPDGVGGQPPRGMVIVFATGNEGIQLSPGFELSLLPQVIGVGASDADDLRASFSNFGAEMEFMAAGGGNINLGVTTTDTHDDPEAEAQGYNFGGFGVFPGTDIVFGPDIDQGGNYTGFFGGTSAACPIAAGVAGLILSVNPDLTATQVRLIMGHTCDRVSPQDAAYDKITSHSLHYGYGRINAARAVEAARTTLSNGGLVWPDIPSDARVERSVLHWKTASGTREFLVLEFNSALDFVPQDGACYAASQSGCTNAALTSLPTDVSVLYTGCATAQCETGGEQSKTFTLPTQGIKRFGIYGRNSIGMYSFGARAESQAPLAPAVTIAVTPKGGISPLAVRFTGNAVSDVPIDESRTEWDFDIDDGNDQPDATTRTATHTYTVGIGTTRMFIARLTMFDQDGRSGSAEIGIRVQGGETTDPDDPTDVGILRIVVGLPGSPGSDVEEGTAPFEVILSVDATGLEGTLQSVLWDLGDGTAAASLVVPHTYQNQTSAALRLPITATVTTREGSAPPVSTTATKIITVEPGEAEVDPGEPDLPGTTPGGDGGAAVPCSGLGMIPLILMLTTLMWMRRRP